MSTTPKHHVELAVLDLPCILAICNNLGWKGWTMDWPLAGALTGIVLFTGAAAYGVLGIIQSSSPPPHKVAKSAEPVLVPGEQLAPREQFNDTTPLISLSNPPHVELAKIPPPPRSRLLPPLIKAVRPPTSVAPQPSLEASKSPQSSASLAMPSPPPAQQTPAVVQWRVVATANASPFNLGGHIDNAGTVDSVASGHMRDAFKSHRNFSRLPPDIKVHILTQNISLTKIAPYRGLLGIDDKKIELEQAVRFERVGGSRGSG